MTAVVGKGIHSMMARPSSRFRVSRRVNSRDLHHLVYLLGVLTAKDREPCAQLFLPRRTLAWRVRILCNQTDREPQTRELVGTCCKRILVYFGLIPTTRMGP